MVYMYTTSIIVLWVFPQIIDEDDTQFMTNCPPAVTESTPRRRTRIQVFWTAPPSGSGCITLKWVVMLGQVHPQYMCRWAIDFHNKTQIVLNCKFTVNLFGYVLLFVGDAILADWPAASFASDLCSMCMMPTFLFISFVTLVQYNPFISNMTKMSHILDSQCCLKASVMSKYINWYKIFQIWYKPDGRYVCVNINGKVQNLSCQHLSEMDVRYISSVWHESIVYQHNWK